MNPFGKDKPQVDSSAQVPPPPPSYSRQMFAFPPPPPSAVTAPSVVLDGMALSNLTPLSTRVMVGGGGFQQPAQRQGVEPQLQQNKSSTTAPLGTWYQVTPTQQQQAFIAPGFQMQGNMMLTHMMSPQQQWGQAMHPQLVQQVTRISQGLANQMGAFQQPFLGAGGPSMSLSGANHSMMLPVQQPRVKSRDDSSDGSYSRRKDAKSKRRSSKSTKRRRRRSDDDDSDSDSTATPDDEVIVPKASTSRRRMSGSSEGRSEESPTASRVERRKRAMVDGADGDQGDEYLEFNGEQRLSIDFEQLGELTDPPERLGKKGIVPDKLAGCFVMYSERWYFEVKFLPQETDPNTGKPLSRRIEWRIRNESWPNFHSLTENRDDSLRRNHRGVSLCNRVFTDAMEMRAKEFERLLKEERVKEKPDVSQISFLESRISVFRPKRFSEGPLLFGLRHNVVQRGHSTAITVAPPSTPSVPTVANTN